MAQNLSGRRFSRPVAIAFVAAALAVSGLAAVFVLSSRPAVAPGPMAVNAAPAMPALGQVKRCEAAGTPMRTCQLEYLRAKTDVDGVEAAFADLKILYDEDEIARGFCHQLAHEIGHAGYKKYGAVGTAFEHGDNFCWSGYHHGVLESYVQEVGLEKLPGLIDGVCADVPGRDQYTFGYFNCVHGLGHGLMAVTNDKVKEALALCDGLDRDWDKDSCYGGAFMQNVINEDLVIHTPDFKKDDPYYPCDAVGPKYQDACYKMQTSHILKVVGRDFAKVFAVCAKVPDKDQIDTCYTSLGRDASGSTVSDVKKTHDICMLGKDERQLDGCIIGAVKDFISFHHSDVQAKELCASFDGAEAKGLCLRTADQYYAQFEK